MDIHKEYFNNFFIPLLKKEANPETDVLFILGDVFDNRQSINVLTQNFALDIIKELSLILPLYGLLGNHDVYYKNNNLVHSLKVIEPYFVKIFESPEILNENIVNDKRILVMPWAGESYDKEVINELEIINRFSQTKKIDYVLAHTEIKNSFYNKFQKSEHGLDINLVDKIKYKIISGHIHIRQEDKKYLYLGSPLSFTRGDVDNEKGIYCLDLEKNKTKFYPNDVSPKFIIIGFPQFMNMQYEDFIKLINKNFVDLKIPDSFTNVFPFSKVTELASNAKNISFNIVSEEMVDYISIDFSPEEISEESFNLFRLLFDYTSKLNFSSEVIENINQKINDLRNRASLKDEFLV
jgi:hypothetical protein